MQLLCVLARTMLSATTSPEPQCLAPQYVRALSQQEVPVWGSSVTPASIGNLHASVASCPGSSAAGQVSVQAGKPHTDCSIRQALPGVGSGAAHDNPLHTEHPLHLCLHHAVRLLGLLQGSVP